MMKTKLDIEVKSLALRFESFRSKKLEDPILSYSCFFIQEMACSWASSCNILKRWIKGQSMECLSDWARWSALELTLHMMEPRPARNLQSCIKNYGLGLWEKIPRNKGYPSWAHHEGIEEWRRSLSCYWCFPSSPPLFPSISSSISPLSSS